MNKQDEITILNPREFEKFVEKVIREQADLLLEFRAQSPEILQGNDGSYEIDITARFEALGAEFLVLIECKHHRNPIKREVVQILNDRLRATSGHKGMIFSTARFQSGAIEYAIKHRIALVQFFGGRAAYINKADDYPSRSSQECSAWLLTPSEEMERISPIDPEIEPFVQLSRKLIQYWSH